MGAKGDRRPQVLRGKQKTHMIEGRQRTHRSKGDRGLIGPKRNRSHKTKGRQTKGVIGAKGT